MLLVLFVGLAFASTAAPGANCQKFCDIRYDGEAPSEGIKERERERKEKKKKKVFFFVFCVSVLKWRVCFVFRCFAVFLAVVCCQDGLGFVKRNFFCFSFFFFFFFLAFFVFLPSFFLFP